MTFVKVVVLIFVGWLLTLQSTLTDTQQNQFCSDDAPTKISKDLSFKRHEIADFVSDTVNHLETSNKFFLVTYFTDNILGHSQYAMIINTLYTKATFLHQDSSKMDHYLSIFRYIPTRNPLSREILEIEWDKHDERWNKVIILYNIISDLLEKAGKPENTSSRDIYENLYIVWFDSDLIIANHSFSFNQIVERFDATVDIIISQETNAENGIANTGCIFIRVSKWSKWFLWRWWNDWDRLAGMDQHVFEVLVESLPIEERMHHIKILDVTTINSRFPGLIHHQLNNSILHLAGESNFIRSHIFSKCWRALCDYYSNRDIVEFARPDNFLKDIVPIYPPYGISRMSLDQQDYVSLYKKEWRTIHSDLASLDTFLFNRLQDGTTNMEEMKTVISNCKNALQDCQNRLRETQQSLSKIICDYHNQSNSVHHQTIHSDTRVELLEDPSCSAMKDLFYYDTSAALIFVYERYLLLLHNVTRFSGEFFLPILQSTLDASMELLTVLRYDDNLPSSSRETYISIILNSLAMLHDSRRYIDTTFVNSLDIQKILKYYEYKLFEFRSLYEEHRYYHHVDSPHLSSSNVGKVIDIWKQTWSIWNEMAENYQFFGTGNGVVNSHDEGIFLALRIAYLLCEKQSDDENVNRLEEGRFYLSWVENVMTGKTRFSSSIVGNAETILEEKAFGKYFMDWEFLTSSCQQVVTTKGNGNTLSRNSITRKKKFKRKKKMVVESPEID